MLRHVGQRLQHDVVHGGLDVLGQALAGRFHFDPDRQALRNTRERRAQALLGERCRMQSARKFAQFPECEIQLVGRALQRCGGRLRARLQLSSGQPDRQRQRDEPLLRTVVEVPLEFPALLVARLHESRA